MNGQITKATGSWYQVMLDDGTSVSCRLPGRFRLDDEEVVNPVAVGDIVEVSMQNDGTGIIDRIGDRKNRLVRKATHGRRGVQLLATNVDQVLIVQSLRDPVVKTGFLDRVLVTCEAYEIPAHIIINKTDLQRKSKDVGMLDQLEELYTKLGYGFLRTSIHDLKSVEKLKSLTAGKVSVMTGHSGTGKTSLLNAMSPGHNLKTGEVSRFSSKGKHTTTYAQLIPLDDNAYIVDTPGIREFGLVDVEPYEMSLYFPEMKVYREECRFYNCTHRHEPSCAVRKAVVDELISESRYKSYVNILESIETDMDKTL
jgi:ribosome biogenesis GTPase / thiamine phosphate phosphatase